MESYHTGFCCFLYCGIYFWNVKIMISNISFVIPAYNEENWIEKCILSIQKEMRNYPYVTYEIIAVDNNSTDNTAVYVILSSLCSTHIDVINEKRKGVTFAREAGRKVAKYDIIAFIDADNEMPEGWFTTLSKHFDDKTVAISGPLIYYESNWFIRFGSDFFYRLACLNHRFIGVMLQGGNFVVRKKALEEIGGFDTSVDFYGEDTMTGKLLTSIGDVKFILDLKMNSSNRRLRNQGIISTLITYTVNYYSIHFCNRAITKTHKDYRT